LTIGGSEGLDYIPGAGEDPDRRYAITVKPTEFRDVVPGHVIIQRMFLMAADHTVAEYGWLYLPSVVESGKNVRARVELFHRVTNKTLTPANAASPPWDQRSTRRAGYSSERSPHQRFPRLDSGSCR
jgi:glycine betaine catabolism A